MNCYFTCLNNILYQNKCQKWGQKRRFEVLKQFKCSEAGKHQSVSIDVCLQTELCQTKMQVLVGHRII